MIGAVIEVRRDWDAIDGKKLPLFSQLSKGAIKKTVIDLDVEVFA